MVLSALSAPSRTSVNTGLLELLCAVTLTFSSRKQVPPKLSDDFCVGCVGSCPLLLWGPAGRGLPLKVCLHLLLLSLSPEHCFSFWPMSFHGNTDPWGKIFIISSA